jgi:4-alpha-glucanotransferase
MPKMLGTLLPLSAIGSFKAGETFIDWLVTTHQQAWQFLPLHASGWNQTSLYTSPYAGFGIGLNPLYVRLPKTLPKDPEFITANNAWLADYCLFLALADHFRTDDWTTWPESIRLHLPSAIEEWTEKLQQHYTRHQRIQAYTYRAYAKLHHYAHTHGIQLIGDAPFYIAHHSPLVWAHQQAFVLTSDGKEPFVSGVIKSRYFPRQIWHHPLYDYTNLETVSTLWQCRLQQATTLYDQLRLDSGISFYTYNKIHLHNAALDETVHGPGDHILWPLLQYSRSIGLKVFVENITNYDLRRLQRTMTRLGVRGIVVYTLNAKKCTGHHLSREIVYYSSNHDSMPLAEYCKSKEKALAVRNFLVENSQNLIVPLQDWQLVTERINRPGTPVSQNWHYSVDVNKLTLLTI